MEAKDTVMSEEDLTTYLSTTDLYSAMCVDYRKAFGKQAEISFKAGIREVVEWLRDNGYEPIEWDDTNAEEWQAKLKEWGINYE